MDRKIIDTIEKDQLKKKAVNFNVGDSIAVHNLIDVDKEGKERIQVFKGIVIKKKGTGLTSTFTIRKISHAGVGVEKIFPLNAPSVKKIEFIKKGKVRRAKLYYMRGRTGKSALKILEGTLTPKEIKELEDAMAEDKVEEIVEAQEAAQEQADQQPTEVSVKEEDKEEKEEETTEEKVEKKEMASETEVPKEEKK